MSTDSLDIYVMNVDGSGLGNITPGPDWEISPSWSPDGTKIAVDSDKGSETWRIFTMNADGTDMTAVPDTFGNSPVWSPDGTKIAYSRGAIWVVNIDGSDNHRLADGTDPVWSPDGSKIAFSRSDEASLYVDLYVMDADGSNQRQLAANAGTPFWSPDGSRLVVTSAASSGIRDASGMYPRLSVINADGTGLKQIIDRLVLLSPTWSPGGYVIFTVPQKIPRYGEF